MIDQRLLADIKAAEGCKLTAYKDTNGFWTIGWGHLLPAPCTPNGWAGYTASQAVVDNWLNEDLKRSQNYTVQLPEYASCDTACRQNALIELLFNMGPNTWSEFHQTRAAITAKSWQSVHDDLLASAWAKQVQPHGFQTPGRATRIAGYFLTGEYPS